MINGACHNRNKQSGVLKEDEMPHLTSSSKLEKGSDPSSSAVTKRKQWSREQKLEFIDLYSVQEQGSSCKRVQSSL